MSVGTCLDFDRGAERTSVRGVRAFSRRHPLQIGRYMVIEDIGAGGMGRVRLARDPDGRLVVLKTALHDDDDDDERLRDEGRVGLRVRHKYLVETIECFEVRDRYQRCRPVLVTGFVPGVSALELRRLGALPAAVVARLGRQLAEGLHALHEATDDTGRRLGILHRDVTGGNCMLGHDGTGRVIDLGIARFAESRALRTETGLLRGTLRYLAPELFDGGAYSIQTDLWALGVVLWEALLGRTAVVGSDAVAVSRICAGRLMILEDNEKPDSLIARAIGALLRKNPRDRPKNALEAAALFAMVEKSLNVDVDAATREVVAAAIAGTPLRPASWENGSSSKPSSGRGEPEHVIGTSELSALSVRDALTTPTLVPRAPSGAFGAGSASGSASGIGNDGRSPSGVRGPLPHWPPPAPLTGDVPLAVIEATVALLPDRFTPPPSTPSQGLRNYAQILAQMEQAHEEAWRQTDDASRQALASLPVVEGDPYDGDILELDVVVDDDLPGDSPFRADRQVETIAMRGPRPSSCAIPDRHVGATILLDMPDFQMPPMTPLFMPDTPEMRGLTVTVERPDLDSLSSLPSVSPSLSEGAPSGKARSTSSKSSPTPLDPSEWDRIR